MSHASEDKSRFVVEFATKLRSRGIDAWLDKWEIYPGDSLVDRIFEEGLKNASAVIVVISALSVQKPWVREELNASVVARIQKGTRLIPVVIDEVSVPEALKNTVWVRVPDVNSYEPELDRIVATIYGARSKPPLGPAPPFAQSSVDIPGLQKQDVTVLRIFCEAALEKDSALSIQTEDTAAAAASCGISGEQFVESTEILAEHGLLEKAPILTRVSPWFTVTTAGMDTYLHALVPEYRSLFDSVASLIVNEGKTTTREIAAELGQTNLLLVEHILEVMSSKGLVTLTKTSMRHTSVFEISPRLSRLLHHAGG